MVRVNPLFAPNSKMGAGTKGFDARLAIRPFLVFFYFRALCRSTMSARVTESQKLT